MKDTYTIYGRVDKSLYRGWAMFITEILYGRYLLPIIKHRGFAIFYFRSKQWKCKLRHRYKIYCRS